ncbi:MAG: hypothetical protein P1U56_19790 [Saprospiraceae bacterium]|nr:hypothetical protein [Saprospiraceae bacterium]
MQLKDTVRICTTRNDLPDYWTIKVMPRGVRWKIVFSDSLMEDRIQIGEKWKREHPKFLVSIHTVNPEINIVKLITDIEIEKNQDFFERCAIEYRNLATQLIHQFIKTYEVELDEDYPINTLNPSENSKYKQFGKMGIWRYFFHGIHCCFVHSKTHQTIEVPLIFGLEFGELDPYFFSKYIRSTPEYDPLPVDIYDDYWDGIRIVEKMLDLGKFEEIQSNWPDHKGVVVANRKKIDVKVLPKETETEVNTQHFKLNPLPRKKTLPTHGPAKNLWSKLKSWWS